MSVFITMATSKWKSMDANQVSFPVKQLVKKIEKLAFFVLEVF